MYRIQINEKNYEQKELNITVFVLQYDVENKIHSPLPNEPTFFLDFLLHYYVKEDSYIRKLTKNYQPYSNAFLSNNASFFIKGVEQINTKNEPFKKWIKKYHKKYIATTENDKLLQADYIITFQDTLYMDHVYKGFSYNINCRNIPTFSISEAYYNNVPNLALVIETIIPSYKDNDSALQVKIASNNDYTFFTSEPNKLTIIKHNNWTTLWDFEVENSYAKIFEDVEKNIVGLIDFDEVIHAFDIKTGATINYIEKVDYFLSNQLNLMTHFEEHTPFEIKDKYGNLLLTIPEKEYTFYTLAFSKNENLVALAYDTFIDIWDIKNKSLLKSIFLGKGVWQKLIFSFDSNVIFALLNNNIIHAFAIEEGNIIFTYEVNNPIFCVQDFDISEKYFSVLEVNKNEDSSDYLRHNCKVYGMNFQPLSLDSALLHKLQKQASENSERENKWAKFLLTIPEDYHTSCYINSLKKNLYDYIDWINLGVALEKKKLYEADIECLKIAAELAPHENTINYNFGTAYMKMKAYSTATHYLELSIKRDPKYTSAHINLTMLYFKSKELEKCEAACLNAINTKDIAECYLNLGHAYYVQDKMQEAKDIYLKGLKKYKSSKAFIEDMLGDYDVIALYNIAKNIWSDFVHSLIEN